MDLDIDSQLKGIYILIARLVVPKEIEVGRLGIVKFSKGYYAYVGSALGGLKHRLQRHVKKEKKKRWHIDYLLEKAILEEISYGVCESPMECQLSQYLSTSLTYIPQFGSTDCMCKSHLYFDAKGEKIRRTGRDAFHSLGIEVHRISTKNLVEVSSKIIS